MVWRVKGTSEEGDGRCTTCTRHLNESTRARRHGKSPMVDQIYKERTQKERLEFEAIAVLSYLKAGHEIPSGMLERQLRKLGGIKEIIINPISHTVKIRYDQRVVSADKVRSVLKKLGQGK